MEQLISESLKLIHAKSSIFKILSNLRTQILVGLVVLTVVHVGFRSDSNKERYVSQQISFFSLRKKSSSGGV